MSRCLVPVFCLLSAGLSAQAATGRSLEALQRTGEARSEYERAWRQIGGEQRESFEFLLDIVPGKVSGATVLAEPKAAGAMSPTPKQVRGEREAARARGPSMAW